ncbi:MAG: 30S ribosomal protein S9 [Candidatus Gracilibacteria bacterium]|jgi:small subunit ribosomal protein S9|nr:30S ribosomal protein S9 [Candidatus Gracilibacteria bacterium]
MKKESVIQIETPEGKYFYGIGRRKSSIAKVRLYKGQGQIMINGKTIKEFCDLRTANELIKEPLKITDNLKKFDITVLVNGGGINGQAEAIRHGISRALLEADPLTKITLKKAGLLTRDPRAKERKKPGLKRARRAPQFSKR